jgi:hypothetical protein
MAEELSPESKLYVKEEIEKVKKEVQSKATKTFTTVVMIVGLVTGMGVYKFAKSHIDTTIKDGLKQQGITELKSKAEEFVKEAEGLVADANNSYKTITDIEAQAEKSLSALKLNLKSQQVADPNGHAWIGGIKFVWGTETSVTDVNEWVDFKNSFDSNCFFVITTLPGYIYDMEPSRFHYQRLPVPVDKPGKPSVQPYCYVAIGQ